MKSYTVTRDVPKSECSWLDRTILQGETVHRYDGCTYGCVGAGIAVTLDSGKNPFFELPRDALMPFN